MRLCTLALLVLFGPSACGDAKDAHASARAAEAQAQPQAQAPSSSGEHFEPPGTDGWGRAGSLRYLERCLGGGKPDAPLPLVIMIHGLGDKPRRDWFRGAELVREPMRLIMPQAPTPHHRGFAWFPFRAASDDPALLARGIAGAEAQLARSIALLRARRPTVGRPIVAGFSQGGMLSYALALRHPQLVELSLPISGLLPEPLWPASKAPGVRYPAIAAVHGDADTIVPIDPARRLTAYLRGLGIEAELREFPGIPHAMSDEMVMYSVEVLERAARGVTAGAR